MARSSLSVNEINEMLEYPGLPLQEEENKFPCKEIAYIYHANQAF
jgi:hypothetical protein